MPRLYFSFYDDSARKFYREDRSSGLSSYGPTISTMRA